MSFDRNNARLIRGSSSQGDYSQRNLTNSRNSSFNGREVSQSSSRPSNFSQNPNDIHRRRDGLQPRALTGAAKGTGNGVLNSCDQYFKAIKQSSDPKSLFEEMKEKNIAPDLRIYEQLIRFCEKQENGIWAKDLFAEIQEKRTLNLNKSIYNSLLKVCLATKDIDWAKELYQKMQQPGNEQSDKSTYINLFQVCAATKDLDWAKQLYSEIENDFKSKINSDVLDGFFQVCVETGDDVNFVKDVFSNMIVINKIRPSTYTFTILFRFCAAKKDLDWAKELFEAMKDSYRLQPDDFTYTVLFQVCAATQDLDWAKEIKKEAKIRFDTQRFNELLNVCVSTNEFVWAKELHDEMASLKVRSDVLTYTSLFNIYIKTNELDSAAELVQTMRNNNVSNDAYVQLATICNENNQADFARQLNLGPQDELHQQIDDAPTEQASIEEREVETAILRPRQRMDVCVAYRRCLNQVKSLFKTVLFDHKDQFFSLSEDGFVRIKIPQNFNEMPQQENLFYCAWDSTTQNSKDLSETHYQHYKASGTEKFGEEPTRRNLRFAESTAISPQQLRECAGALYLYKINEINSLCHSSDFDRYMKCNMYPSDWRPIPLVILRQKNDQFHLDVIKAFVNEVGSILGLCQDSDGAIQTTLTEAAKRENITFENKEGRKTAHMTLRGMENLIQYCRANLGLNLILLPRKPLPEIKERADHPDLQEDATDVALTFAQAREERAIRDRNDESSSKRQRVGAEGNHRPRVGAPSNEPFGFSGTFGGGDSRLIDVDTRSKRRRTTENPIEEGIENARSSGMVTKRNEKQNGTERRDLNENADVNSRAPTSSVIAAEGELYPLAPLAEPTICPPVAADEDAAKGIKDFLFKMITPTVALVEKNVALKNLRSKQPAKYEIEEKLLNLPEETAVTYLTHLYPYQQETVKQALRYQEAGISPLISLEMGLGKTYVYSELLMQELIKDPKGHHLCLLPKASIEQTIEVLQMALMQVKANAWKSLLFQDKFAALAYMKRIVPKHIGGYADSLICALPFIEQFFELDKELVTHVLSSTDFVRKCRELIGRLETGREVIRLLVNISDQRDIPEEMIRQIGAAAKALIPISPQRDPMPREAILNELIFFKRALISEPDIHRNDIKAFTGKTSGISVLSHQKAKLIATTPAAQNLNSVIVDEAQNINKANVKDQETQNSGKNQDREAIQNLLKNDQIKRYLITGSPFENTINELGVLLQIANPNDFETIALQRLQILQREIETILLDNIITDDHKDKALFAFAEFLRFKTLLKHLVIAKSHLDEGVRGTIQFPVRMESKEDVHLDHRTTSKLNRTLDSFKRTGAMFKFVAETNKFLTHPSFEEQFNKDTEAYKTLVERIKDGEVNDVIEESVLLKFLFNNGQFKDIVAANRKAIILVDNLVTGNLIIEAINNKHSNSATFYEGGLSSESRNEALDWFKSRKDHPAILVLSLEAGGTGLNIPEADAVFQFSNKYNPFAIEQGISRAFRANQGGEKSVIIPKYGKHFFYKHKNHHHKLKKLWFESLFKNQPSLKDELKTWLNVRAREALLRPLNKNKDLDALKEQKVTCRKKVEDLLDKISDSYLQSYVSAHLNRNQSASEEIIPEQFLQAQQPVVQPVEGARRVSLHVPSDPVREIGAVFQASLQPKSRSTVDTVNEVVPFKIVLQDKDVVVCRLPIK